MWTKILVIDDSETVRLMVRKAFDAYAVDVLEALNGSVGYDIAVSEQPDLVILDVTMPVMNGVEVLTKFKADEKLKAIPVMILTADSDIERFKQVAQIGIRDYMVKPFFPNVLLERALKIVDLKPLVSAENTDSIAAQAGSIADCLQQEGDVLMIHIPYNIDEDVLQALNYLLKERLLEIVDEKLSNVVFDLSSVLELRKDIVEVIDKGILFCVELGVQYSIAVSHQLLEQCKEYPETAHWPLEGKSQEVKSSKLKSEQVSH